jgi:ABC-type uncharacterized transport system fused permease/ATPase subunit
VVRRLKTSHTLKLIDTYRARIANEKRKFVVASGLLLGSVVSSIRRIGFIPFMLAGICLNFVAVQLLTCLILGFLMLKLSSYRAINSLLRLAD